MSEWTNGQPQALSLMLVIHWHVLGKRWEEIWNQVCDNLQTLNTDRTLSRLAAMIFHHWYGSALCTITGSGPCHSHFSLYSWYGNLWHDFLAMISAWCHSYLSRNSYGMDLGRLSKVIVDQYHGCNTAENAIGIVSLSTITYTIL